MLVKIWPVGMQLTNCYLVGQVETREALVIDPGTDSETEAKKILKEHWPTPLDKDVQKEISEIISRAEKELPKSNLKMQKKLQKL